VLKNSNALAASSAIAAIQDNGIKIEKCYGNNVKGSNTTPKGTFTISDKRFKAEGFVAKSSDPEINGALMGPVVLVYDQNRSLYVHGGGYRASVKKNALPTTHGCIRLQDNQLVAMYDKIEAGSTKIVIGN
jgi:lipoprotein-anchoring transpeptidase ErfK/SrfK